jgi:hypothetical protein
MAISRDIMNPVSRGGFMIVGSKRRFAFPMIKSGTLDPFDQIRWIDPTLRIEMACPLLNVGNDRDHRL